MDDAPIDNDTYGRRNELWKRIDKYDVGLDSVDNTTDENKPVSRQTQMALDGKEAFVTIGTAGQYWRGDKTWAALNKATVGLGNVDNTPDVKKHVEQALVAEYVKGNGRLIQFSVIDPGDQPAYIWGGRYNDAIAYDALRIRVGEANNADNANAIGGIESADIFAQLRDIVDRIQALEKK